MPGEKCQEQRRRNPTGQPAEYQQGWLPPGNFFFRRLIGHKAFFKTKKGAESFFGTNKGILARVCQKPPFSFQFIYIIRQLG
jgi:hypothetical protein